MPSQTSPNSWWQIIEKSGAGRMTAQLLPAQTRQCADAAWQIEEPRHQIGYVRMWNARAIDLSALFFGAFAFHGDYADAHQRQEHSPNDETVMGGTESEFDGLALRLGLALQPPLQIMLHTNGPLTWPAKLFPFQKEGVLTLLQSDQLLLADEMGLGKTIQAIAAIRLLAHRHEIRRTLIVAPAGLLEQWRSEVQKWAPELRVITINGTPQERRWQWQYQAHITLVSYDTLRSDGFNTSPTGPCHVVWDVMVLDEAQRIKNSGTEVAIICKKIARRRSWALTGTPLENSSDDVASILEFVTGKQHSNTLLRPLLNHHQLRRRKSEVLQELPPKISTTLRLPLSPAQHRAYQRAETEGLVALRADKKAGEIAVENVLALITRLKQICNFEAASGDSAKLEDVQNRLQEITAAGHKALVFTQYTDALFGARRLGERLKQFSPLLYTGDLNNPQRNQIIDQFNTDPNKQVLILSLRAGGQGLNLQNASYVFHFDQWWNPATAQQAEDRTHRLGQTRHVHVYRYLMQDTIEERIAAVLADKTYLFDQLIDDAPMQAKPIFSQEELLGLVGL